MLRLMLLLILATCSAQASAKNQPYKPTLYFKGGGVAFDVAEWLVGKNPEADVFKRPIKLDLKKLRNGQVIRYNTYSTEALALDRWVLSQPDASIHPSDFFKRALTLCDYNIELGLILAWDYLSRDWWHALERNNLPASRKFIDLTGELPLFDGSYHFRPVGYQRGGLKTDADRIVRLKLVTTKRGDNRGAWYHMAGTALAAYYYAAIPTGRPWFVYFLTEVEKYWYRQTAGIANKKRLAIDRAGADFGYFLRRSLKRENGNLVVKESFLRDRRQVLIERPDFYGADYILQEDDRPKDFEGPIRSDDPYYHSTEYLKSLLAYFASNTKSNDPEKQLLGQLAMNPVRLFLSGDGDLLTELLAQYTREPAHLKTDQNLAFLLERSNISSLSMQDLGISYEGLTSDSKRLVALGWARFTENAFHTLEQHRYEQLEVTKKTYESIRRGSEPIYQPRRKPSAPSCQDIFDADLVG